jgi:phosphoserine phosphatase
MKERFFVFIRFIPLEIMIGKFWERNGRKIRPWYRGQRQDADVIISASPEFLLAPIVKDILKVRLIASFINVSTGKFTGRNCYGEEKVRRFREVYGDEKIDSFFSDDYADMPLMRIAEHVFLVK